jgi:DNA-binding winged helix-turn-helix (wHTH) protein/TolB-like protein/Tfp pilus assembly protein PilF
MRAKRLYEFGPFRLDAAERLLLRDGEVVPLTLKVFDALVLLVENSGHLLEREQLLRAVWADSFVEEANLTVSISALRRALGEQADGKQYIETVPKRGYRFVADVRMVGAEQEDLILQERTRTQFTIEQDEEREDQSEIKAEIEDHAKTQAKARISRRVKRRALIAGVAMVLMMAGAAYWWNTIRAKQAQAGAQIRSIAVLPFKQVGEGEKDELVGFGMADVLITRLGSLNRIAVRPTSAVFKYVGAEPDIASVGKELNVDAVLEGNIQRIGERIRVTARLVRVRDGEWLWAEAFDGRFKDLFSVQDQVSEQAAVALSLNPHEQRKLLTKRYTKSGEAYQAYMRGRYFWNKRTPDDLKKAVEHFEQAIEKDSSYALAFAGLADSYALLGEYGVAPAREVFPKMKVAAARAVEIDDQLAEAHTSLAYAKRLFDWDWPGAEQEFKLAIELNYSYATAHHWYSEYLAGMGRFEEALGEAKRAEELDPQSLIINTNLGWILYLARRYDEAIEELKKTLELEPSFFLARKLVWQSYVQKGMYEEALAWDEMSVVPKSPEAREMDEILGKAYEMGGWKGFERKELELELEREKRGHVLAGVIAASYGHNGDYDQAFKWLQKAYENREANMVWLKIDPFFDDLRSDPRFRDLLRRMRLEP